MKKRRSTDDYSNYDDQGNILFRIALGLLSLASGGDKRMDIPADDDRYTRQEWPKERKR